jgi:hypothetical protein
VLTQPLKKRMRIDLKLLEAGGGADRERALPIESSRFTHGVSLASVIAHCDDERTGPNGLALTL